MPEAKALALFDIDGTLLRGAGPHHRDALIAGILAVTGVQTTMEGIATAGTLDRDLITLMLGATGWPKSRVTPLLADITMACHVWYEGSCPETLRDRVCPGLPRLLEELRENGVLLGVVSGNLRRIGQRKLELAGLWPYFSVSGFSEDGETRAELARTAAERAKAEHPTVDFTRISLIGDHLNDVIAAKANGFQSVAVATGMSTADELIALSPDVLLPNLEHAHRAMFCVDSI